jgi:hypothetical protein
LQELYVNLARKGVFRPPDHVDLPDNVEVKNGD